jgi:hypothetical protein
MCKKKYDDPTLSNNFLVVGPSPIEVSDMIDAVLKIAEQTGHTRGTVKAISGWERDPETVIEKIPLCLIYSKATARVRGEGGVKTTADLSFPSATEKGIPIIYDGDENALRIFFEELPRMPLPS